MSVERNKAVALRFLNEGWGTRPNWECIWDAIVAPEVVHHFNSDPNPIVGLADNKTFNSMLFQGFPAIEHTLEAMVAEDDKVVYRTALNGRHTGEFLGMPPTGKTAQINDFTMLRIVEGKIVEWWYDCNLLALMQQLGLMPTD
ncbi:MAG: ester cyclase [Leptolyngbya foveolarum]|uniref:Ester cyclase n=1 Tax=Leptolyngbya foveolarum TaxID=47253 RepID=A0A2W4UJI3_9CYAN|nr:MAG: ester cyclase [Leptolyngbya foveolarum]